MPSTLTGTGASATQSTAPTASVPADGDSLAASGVQGPIQTILNHIAKLWAGAFTGQATASPGLTGTGGTTAPGVAAVAGGGGTPARGAVNLTPQVAPSAPSDGDVWVETTSNQVKARVAGATQILTPTGTTPVAITPNAGWTAARGLAYWRDTSGIVHLKGSVGPGGTNPVFTLPAGFRPLTAAGVREFIGASGTSGTVAIDQSAFRVAVNSDGTVNFSSVLGAGLPSTTNVIEYFVDVVSFLSEQ